MLISVVWSLNVLFLCLPSLRRWQYMFRHPSEPLEPHIRCVVHTHLHPGWLVCLLHKAHLQCSHEPFGGHHCCNDLFALHLLPKGGENDVAIFITFSRVFRSRCWTSQTPTARPTVRPHSSIRKTRGSTRRGWRPSWSRAGWMSELLSLSAPSSPSPSLHHPSTPVFHLYLIKKRKKNSNYIRRTQVPPWKKKKKDPENNQTRMDINLLANTFEENEGGEINLIFVFLVLNFTFFIAWCEISYC